MPSFKTSRHASRARYRHAVGAEISIFTRRGCVLQDPLVNLLVNDGGFATAVHAQQVHTAAALAVSLLRVRYNCEHKIRVCPLCLAAYFIEQ